MSNNYWIDRFEKEEEIINNLSKRHIKLAHKQYDRALRNINRKIYEWYGKYAKNNNISFSQAKEELSISDLKDLKMSLEEYIEKGESLNIKRDEKVLRDMINASTRVHIDKLESLKLQIKAEINLLTKNMETITENHLSEVFQDTYYRTAYITQFGIKHFEDINRLNPELIKGFIHKPWTSDNVNWSKRLWGHDNRISNMIHEGLSQNIVAGISLDKIIDNIADRFNTEKHIASRLVMTESAAYHSRAKEQCFKDLDVERYQIVATLDNKTSNICREMDGKIFFMKDYQVGITAPPFHANCRTVTAPYYEDIEGDKNTRAARNEKGNYQEVEDISYKEWFEKYVKEDDTIKLTLEEERAIMKYKSPGGEIYQLNHKLREGEKLTDEEKKWTKNLDSLLKKMPYYKGEVSRCLTFETNNELNKFLYSHVPGKIMTYEAYTSVSVGELFNEKSQVILKIHSTKARDVRWAGLPEDESIYERGCQFKVIDVYFNKEMKIIMELEEVDG